MENEQVSPRAVILLSGGLDSTTVLAIASAHGYDCYCLSFRYGQKQAVELQRAALLAEHFKAKRHLILQLDLGLIGGSALTDNIAVPKDREMETSTDIPVTYVPARNTIMLAHALAWAEVIGAAEIFIGVNAIDYSGYPDCRPEFLEAFTVMANLGTKAGCTGTTHFRIRAPLMTMSKADIIKTGLSLGVDYAMTHSCYDPEADAACGRCDACRLRLQGFAEVGIRDPAPYREKR
ncbi:MAG: 7-cyano-7-deazaguanine synthase QueC [Desulfofustis sp.]|nr:7-cyano-7-deazaguanine synthase QueC [Desulfofustis sp.]